MSGLNLGYTAVHRKIKRLVPRALRTFDVCALLCNSVKVGGTRACVFDQFRPLKKYPPHWYMGIKR